VNRSGFILELRLSQKERQKTAKTARWSHALHRPYKCSFFPLANFKLALWVSLAAESPCEDEASGFLLCAISASELSHHTFHLPVKHCQEVLLEELPVVSNYGIKKLKGIDNFSEVLVFQRMLRSSLKCFFSFLQYPNLYHI
jgi:hypothetical protein